MLGADCCCFCSASTDVGPAGCHWVGYVTASVGYECGCTGGGGKTPPAVFTPPSWPLVSSALTCKPSTRTCAAQLRPSRRRGDRWTATCDRLFQRQRRVSHRSLITPSHVDARMPPFVKCGLWDYFITGWSGSGPGENNFRLRPLVPFLQLRLMLKARFIGFREQPKRQKKD